jgi:PEP-CTERM motif
MNARTTLTKAAAAASLSALALLLSPGAAVAGTQQVEGWFINDNDLWSTSFDLVQGDTLTVTTSSYALGGFAPVLTLFQDDADGLLQTAQGNGGCEPEGFCWDATLKLEDVNAGRYTLVLSQDGNDASGPYFADGFSKSGYEYHDYTSVFNPELGTRFIQVDRAQRTGYYALEISAPLSPAVPEPATTLMLLAGLAGLALLGRRTRPAQG